MIETRDESGPIAILAVHGIGAQQRGESSRKLIAGLGRVDRDLDPNRADGVITVGGQPVRVYEVYWADLLMGDNARDAFQMTELQSLAWFPWFNYWRRNYPPGSYALAKLACWWVTLPIVNFFALFAYYGAGFLAQVLRDSQPRPAKEGASLWTRAKDAADAALPTVIHRVLDEYVGDVFSYVNSAGNAFDREEGEAPVQPGVEQVYSLIVQRFYDTLLEARADGCAGIQVVAHSLGTVVAYHALAGLRFESERRADADAIRSAILEVRRLYTIGSPLEKIRFFWPQLMAGGPTPGGTAIRWDNFVSWFDPVAGRLTRFDGWGRVVNHRLLGGGFLRGHVVYEHSPVFLGALTRGLCGHELPFVRTRREQWRDRLVLAAETLFAPTALAIVLLCGMALFVLTALLLPFLLSLILRLFLPEPTWVHVENVSALVFIGLMVLVFLRAPITRASRVHRLHWAATGSAGAGRRAG
jgi:hypothetical protein